MNLVLDTSILIELERGNDKIIGKLNQLRILYPSTPKISFISYFEFLYGLRKKSIGNKEKSRAFVELFSIIHTTNKTADILVLLKSKYDGSLSDLLIASQVMEGNCILVTRDNDFDKISEINRIII